MATHLSVVEKLRAHTMERASLTAGYGYVSTANGQHWDITSKTAGVIDAVDIQQEDGLVFSLIRWRTLGMDSSSQPRIKTKRVERPVEPELVLFQEWQCR